MKRIAVIILHRLLALSSAELALLSFLSVSLLGAVTLMWTEHGHMTTDAYPIHRDVVIREVESGVERQEVHTSVAFKEVKGLRFVDAWFTSTSALCVTGLTTIDFSQFTLAGQLIVLLLIQSGGLGIFVLTAILVVSVFQGVEQNVSFRAILASTVDSSHRDALTMLKYIVCYSVVLEGMGILVMGVYLEWFAVNPPIGNLNPWWWALFHSLSAFNNAGFSLMVNNLESFAFDPVINLTISLLIILGGLGYPVLIAFFVYARRFLSCRKESKGESNDAQSIAGVASVVQIKVAVYGTLILLIVGTVLTYWVEFENSIKGHPHPVLEILPAWFQSVSIRTAGFNTVDIGDMHVPTLFLFIVLMFIGGNPAGTAGGVKIPTIVVLFAYIVDWFKKPGEPVRLFGQPVSRFAVSHAIRLFFFGIVFVALTTATINYLERHFVITGDPTFSFSKVLFEVVSAFGTVGLSMGFPQGPSSFSALLSDTSKYLIMVTMFFGRIGPLVLLAALPWKRRFANYPPSQDYPGANKVQIG
ncbi:MAG: potassium transporter TrkG [Candidatus Competibacteraceae bacterium]|jgi:trk system potassium uptake protein TrkH|nr:potassium transporter TrkG [Candidatus Competibacteraceae bacterium]